MLSDLAYFRVLFLKDMHETVHFIDIILLDKLGNLYEKHLNERVLNCTNLATSYPKNCLQKLAIV